jgi:hypothetical protein
VALGVSLAEQEKLQNELADPIVRQGLSNFESVQNHLKTPRIAAK